MMWENTKKLQPAEPRLAASGEAGFSLIEVIIAASILALGLLSIVQVFPYGIEAGRRAEDLTQATLLAQTIFEGLKTDPVNFPIIPGGTSLLIPMPGNAYDDDDNNAAFNLERYTGRLIPTDLNGNRLPDEDYDGMPEEDALRKLYLSTAGNGWDDDNDGVVDDDGDSGSTATNTTVAKSFSIYAQDGDLSYDPEPNIDEEYADGKDNDKDGLIDEDCRLASVRLYGAKFMIPLLAGDGVDNDGDGEDNDKNANTPAVADGVDNNGDGRIDEGIDEEIWDGLDNDKDGMVDEDCRAAAFPFMTSKLPAPYDRYAWQIRVGRIPNNGRFSIADINGDGAPDLGDGIDNDGDGRVDEEIPDGLDFDFPIPVNRRGGYGFLKGYTQAPKQDGLIDEDCISIPLPNWRKVEILITWGGDGVDNDKDTQKVDPKSQTAQGTQNIKQLRSMRISYGGVDWGIDEEKLDGIDNDFDGQIDEDTYKYEFKLVGFINLKDPAQSFTLIGGQPRGLISFNASGQ